jgi:nicotinamidase-related amidase
MKYSSTFILILYFLFFSTNAKSQEIGFFENKYLIVLDMQEDYIAGKISDSIANEFIKSVNTVIGKVDTNRIVYVKTEMIVASLSFKGISIDTIANLDFYKNLNVVNNNIFIKEGGNAFANTELADFFKNEEATDIIIIGLLAEKCVFHSSIGGLAAGYNIYLIPNAILSKKEKTKYKTMSKLKKKGAEISNDKILKNEY